MPSEGAATRVLVALTVEQREALLRATSAERLRLREVGRTMQRTTPTLHRQVAVLREAEVALEAGLLVEEPWHQEGISDGRRLYRGATPDDPMAPANGASAAPSEDVA